MIQHIYDSHFDGVEQARGLRDAWKTLKRKIDNERYEHVLDRFNKQVRHAEIWRDSINSYFYEMSKIPDEKARKLTKK
ncbi:Xylan alpha-(1-_2)-glucuronosidase [subsurface metagenome]